MTGDAGERESRARAESAGGREGRAPAGDAGEGEGRAPAESAGEGEVATAGLRTAMLDDLGAIMALERASFPTDAWSERALRAELASPHGHYVVIAQGGAVAGYAGLRAVAGSHDGDIQTIAVAAAPRGHGWGRMLLTTLIDEAGRRGVRDLFLEVRADNPVAQALYISEGFVEIGRRPRYYQPDDVDAIVMQADLRGRAAASASVDDSQTSEHRAKFGGSSPNHPESARSSEPREVASPAGSAEEKKDA